MTASSGDSNSIVSVESSSVVDDRVVHVRGAVFGEMTKALQDWIAAATRRAASRTDVLKLIVVLRCCCAVTVEDFQQQRQ